MNQVMIAFYLGMFIGCSVGFLAAGLFFMAKGEQRAVEEVIEGLVGFRQADGGLVAALRATIRAGLRVLFRPYLRKDW